MALPTPPRFTNPIPNNPFYYPEGNFIYGDTGPLIVGAGLNIDYTTGVISAAGGGGGVASIFAGPGIGVNANTGVVTITNTGVTSITTGAGLTGGPITSTGTISLGTTGVTPGTYSLANITVDAQGRLSAASSGTAVLSVTGTAPVNVTTGVNPTISIAPSSTTSAGIVQLNNTLSSNSTTEALTAAQGLILQNQINALSVSTNLTFAGTFDATLAHMDSVTTEGAAEGFTLGADLPVPAASNDNFFVIVTTEGTYSPPGGGGPYAANRGDWFLSNGTTWEYLNVGADLPVASTGSQGIVELATVAETQAGTSTTLAVTPAGTAATYIPCSLITAKGNIIAATGSGTPVVLPVGTSGQVLSSNPAALSGLQWITPTAGTVTSVTAGTGLTGGTITSTGTIALNAACVIAPSTLTAKGSILTATAASTPSALSVGTDGQVLTACSACPSGLTWVASSSPALATATTCGLVYGRTSNTGTSVSLGYNALLTTPTSNGNVALGFASLCSNTTGDCNTSVGFCSMRLTAGGVWNSSVGAHSLCSNVSGHCNVAAGYSSLCLNSSGCDNVGIGHYAGCAITTGCNNVAIGSNVQVASATGNCQLAIGYSNGQYWLTGTSTKAIKPGAGIIDCASSCGTAGQVLMSNGANAVCWGSPACAIPTAAGIVYGCSGGTNTSLGLQALCSVFSLTGTDNTAIGYRSAVALSGFAFQNTAVGACALQCATVADDNVAVGWKAAFAITTGSQNVALGSQALTAVTSGGSNVGVGPGALFSTTTSFGNTAVGQSAAQFTAGACNTAVGYMALGLATTGNFNTVLGADAGCLTLTSGSGNTIIGACAGFTNGNNNVVIGCRANSSSTTVSNEVTLYNGCTAAGFARFQGNTGAWSFASDGRKKEDIVPLALGVDFVNDLQPRGFSWKETKEKAAGFIAQEVNEVVEKHDADYLGLVVKDDPECWMLAQTKIIPVLVKAIQELSAKVETLEAQIAANG